MKIALDISNTQSLHSSTGRYIYLLLQKYLEFYPEQEYVLYRLMGIRNLSFDKKFLPGGTNCCQIRTIPFIGRYANTIRRFWHFDDLFLKDIDIFHGYARNIPLFFRKKKKIFLTIYDIIPLIYPEFFEKRFRAQWFEFSKTIQYAQFDRIIAVSECTQRDLVNVLGVPQEKIKVIPLAVAPEFVEPVDPHELKKILSELGLNEEYILVVGRLEPRKNIPRIIQAYELVRSNKNFLGKLVIVGNSYPLSKPVFDAYFSSPYKNDIMILKYVSSKTLRCLYQGALVLAFVSLYEGFGFPILEAFASGIPVVTSKKSSLPEVGGEAALYVEPQDVISIAEGLKEVVQDETLRKALVQKGKEKLKEFSWEKTAQETFELYLK